jgi:hypothetical protein
MEITCRTARTVADWPIGTRFRVNNVMYTKTGDGETLNTFLTTTFKDGEEKNVKLTVYPSDSIVLVRLPS